MSALWKTFLICSAIKHHWDITGLNICLIKQIKWVKTWVFWSFLSSGVYGWSAEMWHCVNDSGKTKWLFCSRRDEMNLFLSHHLSICFLYIKYFYFLSAGYKHVGIYIFGEWTIASMDHNELYCYRGRDLNWLPWPEEFNQASEDQNPWGCFLCTLLNPFCK